MMNQNKWRLLWRATIILLLSMMVMRTSRPVAAQAPPTGPVDPQEIEALFDPLMADLMTASEAPGGAIALVKDGQLLFAKGYGYADEARRIPVEVDQTLFRAGSVSKPLTWTAVMQLVEQGKLDLDTDVNTYLHDFQIPATYPQPITLRHLMTHTAGFEDQEVYGKLVRSDGNYQALSEFLADNMPARVYPPGEVVAYSNYGAALAGEIVAEVSGESFESYMTNHILVPLAMNHSSFQQPLPPELAQLAATGYAANANGLRQAHPYQLMLVRPAAALSSTVTDMAHFMIAHLQGGRYENAQILQAATIQTMHQQARTFHPGLPGLTLGFGEYSRNDLQLLYHPGDMYEAQSLLVLIPEQNMGFYLALNAAGRTSQRIELMDAVLDHYYPAAPASTEAVEPPTTVNDQNLTDFTGSYLGSQRGETNSEKLLAFLGVIDISANADQTLRVSVYRDDQGEPVRWVAISPMLFQEVGSQRLLAFRTDENGQVSAIQVSDRPVMEFQKLSWLTNPMNHLIGLLLALVIFGVTAIVWLTTALWHIIRRRAGSLVPLERKARALAVGLVVLNLLVVGLIIPAILNLPESVLYALPALWLLDGALILVSAIGAVVVLLFTIRLWQQHAGSMSGRLHYTAVMVAALYFVWFFVQANFVIFRF